MSDLVFQTILAFATLAIAGVSHLAISHHSIYRSIKDRMFSIVTVVYLLFTAFYMGASFSPCNKAKFADTWGWYFIAGILAYVSFVVYINVIDYVGHIIMTAREKRNDPPPK